MLRPHRGRDPCQGDVNLVSNVVDRLGKYGIRLPDSELVRGLSFSEFHGWGIQIRPEGLSRAIQARMPNNLLAIENCDEWQEYIDCDTGEMVSWGPIEGMIIDYPDFDAFLLDRTQDAIESL